MGAGPAGLYAVDELVRQQRVPVCVDVIDRLCTPFGLVRYGVAPDHPRIKSVIGSLDKIIEHPSVRFLGGVELGFDLDRADLLECFDAIVYASGAAEDRTLGIAGESLPGSHSARELVSWYSGHPDARQPCALDSERVAVIGAGNVALDVARVLTKPVDALSRTDMPEPVLDALRSSAIREVTIVGRRGPEHTRFTTKELRELYELDGVSVRVPSAEAMPANDAALGRTERNNLDLFRRWAGAPAGERTITFRFWHRPIEIRGEHSVRELILERTELDRAGSLVGTGELESLPVGLTLRSVGYRSTQPPDVPFDADRGVVRHRGGRVIDEQGVARPGEYVTGWLKRGPTGVIGHNRADSAETVAAMLDDLERAGTPRATTPVDAMLRSRRIEPVRLSGWRAIDSGELALGARSGRERVKITNWLDLRALGATAAGPILAAHQGKE